MLRLAPVFTLNLEQLRRAGRFASPDGEGDPAPKKEDKPAGDPPPKKEEKPEDKPADTQGRISTLVEERNGAQREAAEWKVKFESAQTQLQQLQATDKDGTIKDLQTQLSTLQNNTKTRFDKLLETELATLSEAAQKAVKAIPGGSEAQFDWLIANRAILLPAGDGEGDKSDGPPKGPQNDKKPKSGDDAGASSTAKGYVERQKPQKTGYPGLTG